jgi:3-oxoadipate enol-lactonase
LYKFFNNKDICLYYDRLGEGGEPLVLIHGLGERKEGWELQHELADEFDLIIPDLRGHGKTAVTENISITEVASDVLDLLDHLEIENANICGLSMGGLVAQEMYRLKPEKCSSLLLVNTFHYAPRQLVNMVYRYKKWCFNYLTDEEKNEIAAKACLYSINEETMQKYVKFHSPNQSGYLPLMKACLEVDYRKLLRNVKIPTLIIGSQYDAITPIWFQIQMFNLVPDAEIVIFKNGGHVVKLEQTEKFNRTLRNFLHKHRLAAS